MKFAVFEWKPLGKVALSLNIEILDYFFDRVFLIVCFHPSSGGSAVFVACCESHALIGLPIPAGPQQTLFLLRSVFTGTVLLHNSSKYLSLCVLNVR